MLGFLVAVESQTFVGNARKRITKRVLTNIYFFFLSAVGGVKIIDLSYFHKAFPVTMPIVIRITFILADL